MHNSAFDLELVSGDEVRDELDIIEHFEDSSEGETDDESFEDLILQPNHRKETSNEMSDLSEKIMLSCSTYCPNECSRVVNVWNNDEVNKVKESFKGINLADSRKKIIAHLTAQSDMGKATHGYILNSHQFCVRALSGLIGISEHILTSTLKDFWSGRRVYDHGNSGVVKNESVATTRFICWFKSFLCLHSQSAPDNEISVLSYWLRGNVLYDMYIHEAPTPHIKRSTFYKHLKKYFGPKRIDPSLPRLLISKYSSHSVCDVCTYLNERQRLCKSEAELEVVKALRNQHRQEVTSARRVVEGLRIKAVDYPNDHLFIQIDGTVSNFIPFFMIQSSTKNYSFDKLSPIIML